MFKTKCRTALVETRWQILQGINTLLTSENVPVISVCMGFTKFPQFWDMGK